MDAHIPFSRAMLALSLVLGATQAASGADLPDLANMPPEIEQGRDLRTFLTPRQDTEKSTVVGSTHLGSTALTAEDQAIVEQGEAIKQDAGASIDLKSMANPSMDRAMGEATELVRSMEETDPTLRAAKMEARKNETYAHHSMLLFVSLSLGKAALKEVFEMASERQDVVLVFRGVPEGMKLDEGMKHYQHLIAEYDPLPNLVIDPTLYRDFKVVEVPTIIAMDDPAHNEFVDRKVLARVEGLSSPEWLEKQVADGQTGDQGRRGPVMEIAEQDLIEMMQERVASVDWEAKKQAAVGRFWQKQQFNYIPPASHSRTRTIDPSVTVLQDLTGADGKVLMKAGTVLNPLDQVPFTQALVIFDPSVPGQMKILDRVLPELAKQPNIRQLTYLATQMDKEQGWKGYTDLSNRFEAPVYLVTKEIIERFEIEHTPSIVTSDGKVFVVKELTAKDGSAL
ncbi:TrbC family F-type conjugative pilus assembly protein [Pseudomonas sp. LTJR-52]|uniref:TrbC family F-type conjugative pilus assembly protein n=1 Tax=Pseudomonas sp. LTJR-52 TaxID=2479392 RepID=UPI0013CE9591|nr:TrbC family F-type conjugative pilus assembly protein [Pseudomonas sp. LTJR-52]